MPRICFVVDTECPPDAQFQVFREAGWEVLALLHAGSKPFVGPAEVEVRAVEQFSVPEWCHLFAYNAVEGHQLSEAIAHALAILHDESPLAAVVFPQAGGLGFRALQARHGRMFLETTAMVVLTGASMLKDDPVEQLRTGYAERYALANSDHQAPFFKPEDIPVPNPAAGAMPLVSVVVTHYNLGAYLPEALESIARQDYAPLEVIVVDDGSTEPESVGVFQELRNTYRRFQFVRQANGGASAARNTGIQRATGEFVVLMDADNVAMPHMVSSLVRGIAHRPALAALTTFFVAFETRDQLLEGHFKYAYRPAGGPVAMGCFENVFGDTNAIYRTSVLKDIGGFDASDPRLGYQDWDTFVRLVLSGHQLDVLPDYLYAYRHRADSVSRATDDRKNRARIVGRYQASRGGAPEWSEEAWGALAGMGSQWSALQLELDQWKWRAEQHEALLREFQRSVTCRLMQKLSRLLKAMMRKR